MHAWSISMLLLLHSAFMLSLVKMLLKGEVGGCALIEIVMEITLLIMEIHGKPWNCVFKFLWQPWVRFKTAYSATETS